MITFDLQIEANLIQFLFCSHETSDKQTYRQMNGQKEIEQMNKSSGYILPVIAVIFTCQTIRRLSIKILDEVTTSLTFDIG